jgi:hypothetical protein
MPKGVPLRRCGHSASGTRSQAQAAAEVEVSDGYSRGPAKSTNIETLALIVQRDSRIRFSMIHGWSAFGGRTVVGISSNWKEELERWPEPFLD